MRNYLSFILIPFIISSCVFSNCKVKDLPKSEKKWINNYKIGKEYIFKSNLERTDTLTVVDMMDDYTPCNKLALGESQFNIIKVQLLSSKLSKTTYGDIALIMSTEESEEIGILFAFVDLQHTFYELEREVEQYPVFVAKYNDSILAFNFNENNCTSSWGKTIKSFSWSKKYGIVQYETKEGERFELIR